MTGRGKRQLKTGGSAWGRRRVDLGVSIRQLSEASGIAKGTLSMIENGRMVPTGEEFAAVMAALDKAAADKAAAGVDVPVSELAAATT